MAVKILKKMRIDSDEELLSISTGVFWVLEENYLFRGYRSAGAEGILEARKGLPRELTADSIFLDICPESGEVWERFLKKIRKQVAEARRNFRTGREA